MDLEKAVNSTGELLYNFAASIILIPRTFAKVLRQPSWCLEYLNSKSAERPKQKFDKYSSPVLFWIVTGILPYYFLINTYFQGYTEGKMLAAYNSIGAINIIMGISIFLLSFPLSCAFILHLFKRKGFTRSSFRRSLNIQFYLTAPAQLFYMPALFIDEISDDYIVPMALLVLVSLAWFLFVETKIIKLEVNYSWIASIGILILMYLAFYIFAMICFIIFVLINMDHFQRLVDALFDGIDVTPKDTIK